MKTKSLILAVVLCLSVSSSFAQFLRFYANFSNPNYQMNLSCVVPHNYKSTAGDIYVVGNIDSTYFHSTNQYIYVAELDPSGNIVWQKQYRISPSFSNYYCVSAMETSDGYLVVAGTDVQYGYGFVFKINAYGANKNMMWFQRFNQNTFFERIVESPVNLKYYVSGQDQSVGVPATGEDGLLVEVNPANGLLTTVSNRTLSGSETWSGVAFDQLNNCFYLGGRYNYNVANTMMRPSITKMDATTYNELWTYPYLKNISTDKARLYLRDLFKDGTNLVAVGEGDETGQSIALTQQFIRTDLNGTLLSGQKYGVLSGSVGTLHQILPVPGSSDYIILGDLNSTGTTGNAYLMRVDNSGTLLWSNSYSFTIQNYMGNYGPKLSGMTIQGGNVYVVGQYQPPGGQPKGCLLRVDPATGILDGCSSALPMFTGSIPYQGPLSSMTLTTGTFKPKKVTSKKLTIVLDWNLICQYIDPCASFTVNAGPDVAIASCCTVNFNATVTAGTPGYTYSWSPTNGLSNPNIANPVCSTPGTYTVTVIDANDCITSDAVIVSPGVGDPCCRIGGIPDQAFINAYPNPTSGSLMISFNGIETNDDQIIVSDLTGATVQKFKAKLYREGNEFRLNISNLAPGVYMIYLLSSPSKPIRIIKQ